MSTETQKHHNHLIPLAVAAAYAGTIPAAARILAHTTSPILTAFIMAAFTTSGLLPLAALVQAILPLTIRG